MKRRNLFVTILTMTLVICMLSQGAAFANWEPYYPQYPTGDAARVTKTYNDMGQTVYTAYNSYGTVVLDIRARAGNIWNNTSQILLSDSNKSQELVGIDTELNVYGINYSQNPMKYRNGFLKGEVPYVLSNVNATSLQTDGNGFVTGFYTGYGVYDLDSNNANNRYDDDYYYDYDYDSYPRVTQQGKEYYYYHSNYDYDTYEYNPNTQKLSYNGSSITGITEIAFGRGYLFAVTTSNVVYQIEVGTLYKEKTYRDEFCEWMYENRRDGIWVIGYIDDSNREHYFDIDDYDDYYDDDYYYDNYPYITQNGTKYTYYASSSKSYTFNLSSAGNLSYNGTTIAYDVEQVDFAKGYLVYVAYDNNSYYNQELTCYKVKLGSTSKSKVCSDFYEFEYDYNGFVTEAINESGRSYDL